MVFCLLFPRGKKTAMCEDHLYVGVLEIPGFLCVPESKGPRETDLCVFHEVWQLLSYCHTLLVSPCFSLKYMVLLCVCLYAGLKPVLI